MPRSRLLRSVIEVRIAIRQAQLIACTEFHALGEALR